MTVQSNDKIVNKWKDCSDICIQICIPPFFHLYSSTADTGNYVGDCTRDCKRVGWLYFLPLACPWRTTDETLDSAGPIHKPKWYFLNWIKSFRYKCHDILIKSEIILFVRSCQKCHIFFYVIIRYYFKQMFRLFCVYLEYSHSFLKISNFKKWVNEKYS